MAQPSWTKAWRNQAYIDAHCDMEDFGYWKTFILDHRNSPEALAAIPASRPSKMRAAARLYATGGNAAIYYGLGVTEHTQGTSTVMAIANLAMITGNIGRRGVGVNPLARSEQCPGFLRHGVVPPRIHRISPCFRRRHPRVVRGGVGRQAAAEPGLRIPNMFDAAVAGSFRASYIHGEDIAQSDPDTHHVTTALRRMDCVVVQDLFLNETAKFAHVFLPGTSFLEKDGTFTNAERRINRVRPAMAPKYGGKRNGKSSAKSPLAWVSRWAGKTAPKSWTKSPA